MRLPLGYPVGHMIKFKTKIYHPNVNEEGDLIAEVFHPRFSYPLHISERIKKLRSMQSNPLPYSAGTPKIGWKY